MRQGLPILALCLILAGACQQASAARQLAAAASSSSSYTWLPHKNADNVWQPANPNVDYTTLTLQDLPPPEVFVQIALQSPYPMPDIPMGLLLNNTVNKWTGGKPPSSVQDWMMLMQGAGSFMAESVPELMAKVIPNITIQGQSVSIAAETGKLLKSLPFFNNSTSMALPLPESMVGVGVATPVINLTESVNVTMEILQKLPEMLKKAGDIVVSGVQSVDLSAVQDALLDDEGQLDIPKILMNTLNIDVSQLPPLFNITQAIDDIAKQLPVVAQQLGMNTSEIKFPDADVVARWLIQASTGSDVFITDRLGRVDVLGSLWQIAQKLPELNDVADAVTKALPAPPQGLPTLDEVVQKVVEVSKVVANVANNLQ